MKTHFALLHNICGFARSTVCQAAAGCRLSAVVCGCRWNTVAVKQYYFAGLCEICTICAGAVRLSCLRVAMSFFLLRGWRVSG